jgi:hypothetical protein
VICLAFFTEEKKVTSNQWAFRLFACRAQNILRGVMDRTFLLSMVVLVVSGCGGDEVAAEAGDATTDAGSEGDDAGADAPAPGTDGGDTAVGEGTAVADTGADETGEPEDLPPPPATGIEITEVTVDQGIRVPVARGGELVGPTERNQPLLKNRPAVVRAFYEVDQGYETRAIYALLHLEQLGGEVITTYESFVQTSEEPCEEPWIYDCRYGSASGSFVWRVPAEDLQPGVRYRIELFETAPGHEEDVSDKVPLFPTDGGLAIMGVEDSYMKMRVVLVPFDHAIEADCPEPPDLSEEIGTDYEGNPRTVADFFGERLLAHNPVDEVEILVHDVVPFYGSLQGSQLLGELQEMRFEENAPPEYFYYGVARPCDGGPDFSGVAQLGGPSPGEAGNRVGWGVWHGSVSTTANTFVHEIGHEQGRPHIACNGEEGGPDPSYPDHPEGDTESWGIDVMAMPVSIHPPSAHDYMTYCGSTWVSEWAWSKVLPWIQTMSSWELGVPPAGGAAPQTLLFGRLAADGSASWFLADGWFDAAQASADRSVRLSREGEVVLDAPAIWSKYERTEDLQVIVGISDAAWRAADELVVEGPAGAIAIDKASVAVVGTARSRFD